MEAIRARVAGLDVHKDSVVACVRTMQADQAHRECRTFETTTDGLTLLRDWLVESRCEAVAMEATGVYWTPIYRLLGEGDFELFVANAARIKAAPGRKTDVNDATWIAELAAFGLIKASFVPPEWRQELRTLLRTRKQLARERTSHVLRIQKTLTQANIRLDSALSDIMGASGRRVIEAMIAGERNARKLAALISPQAKASPKQLYDALHGRLTDNHRFLLRLHLEPYDALAQALAKIDAEVVARLPEPKAEGGGSGDQDDVRFLIGLIDDIPGLNWLGSLSVLSEIGVDMRRFSSAGRLIAWAGLCLAQNESAGKRRAGRLRKGAPWLKTMLVQCAWAAVRAKKSYFRAKFHRLKARCGPQKAICAVAASILTAIYHVIARRTPFVDLGVDYFEKRHPQKKLARLLRQIKALGYKAEIQPAPNAA